MNKDLFGIPTEDPFFSGKVIHNFQPTSKESAKYLEGGKSAGMRRKVFDFIRDNEGATDEEIKTETGLTHELVSGSGGRGGLLKAKIVIDSGIRRKNKSGREAIVWKVNKAA
jgi:hypothetical protein